MDNALIDDRRIHVDFSQSVSKLWSQYWRKNHQMGKGMECNAENYFLGFFCSMMQLTIPKSINEKHIKQIERSNLQIFQTAMYICKGICTIFFGSIIILGTFVVLWTKRPVLVQRDELVAVKFIPVYSRVEKIRKYII